MARPTKQTRGARLAVLEALKAGNTRGCAASCARISDDTLVRMIKADESFKADVLRAEAEAVAGFVGAIWKAADANDWRAAAYWLERRRPSEWGRRRVVEESECFDLSLLSDEQLLQLVEIHRALGLE